MFFAVYFIMKVYGSYSYHFDDCLSFSSLILTVHVDYALVPFLLFPVHSHNFQKFSQFYYTSCIPCLPSFLNGIQLIYV